MPDDSDAAVLDAPTTGVAETPSGDAALGELDFGYQVSIDSFSGPMDLLLYLVRRAEVDIADIPIAKIADQFVEMLHATPDLNLDVAGDFILMAATLLEIKSRLVVPPEINEQDDGSDKDQDILDPRDGLVRQLLAYRRFKEATQLLPILESQHEERHDRRFRELIPEDPDDIDGLDLTNCDVGLLYDNFEMILVRINRLGPRTVINDDVPMEHKINGMIDTMRARRESTMHEFFKAEKTVSGRVGVVMATLECARQRFIEAKQFEQFGDVLLRYREDEERSQELSSLPEEEVDEQPKKRRRRIPLVTWRPPERDEEPEQLEIDLPELEEEAVVESDEQRFLRELEESCAVTAVLTRAANLESSFEAFKAEQLALAEAAAAAAAAFAQRAADLGMTVAELTASEAKAAADAAAAEESARVEEAEAIAAAAAERKAKRKARSEKPRSERSHKTEKTPAERAAQLGQPVDLIISSDDDDDFEFDADADDYVEPEDSEDADAAAPDMADEPTSESAVSPPETLENADTTRPE